MKIALYNSKIRIVSYQPSELNKTIHKLVEWRDEEIIPLFKDTDFHIGSIQYWDDINLEIEDYTEKPEISSEPTDKVKLRDYQEEAVSKLLEDRAGWIELPPGSGKTYIMARIIEKLGYPKTIIAAPTVNLAMQIRSDLMTLLNEFIGIYRHNFYDIKTITVTTYSSLLKHKDLRNVDLLIIDEAHHINGNALFIGLFDIPAYYRYGFTATGNTKPEIQKRLNLAFKRCAYSKKVTELQGYLPEIELHLYHLAYEDPRLEYFKNSTRWRQYAVEIVTNRVRNRVLTEIIKQIYEKGENTLILCAQIKHCYILQRNLKEIGISAPIISSYTPNVIRTDILENFDRYRTVLATTILDEGITINSLQNIVIASGQGSTVKAIQRLGRGLRGYPEKQIVKIHDILDDFSETLKNRTKLRVYAYKKFCGVEQAFIHKIERMLWTTPL